MRCCGARSAAQKPRLPESALGTRAQHVHSVMDPIAQEACRTHQIAGFPATLHPEVCHHPVSSSPQLLRPGCPQAQSSFQNSTAEQYRTIQNSIFQDHSRSIPTSRTTTRAPMYPQAQLRPGSWLAGWLAEFAGWLAGWLGGWLAC